MKKAKVSRLIRAAKEDGERAGFSRGYSKGKADQKEETTFYLTPAENETVIGFVPPHDTIRVAVFNPRDMFLYREQLPGYYDGRGHVTFRAVKKGWTSSEGNAVCWYDWELRR